jgi:hypothetical protein
LFDDVAHFEESDLVVEIGCDYYFVGCIENTRHIASFVKSFEGKCEVAEASGVGLLESETCAFGKVESFE